MLCTSCVISSKILYFTVLHLRPLLLSVTDYCMYDENCPAFDVLVIPGGMGTRTQWKNSEFIAFIERKAKAAAMVVTICTGTVLLAQTGI